jgi:hypothetical protein
VGKRGQPAQDHRSHGLLSTKRKAILTAKSVPTYPPSRIGPEPEQPPGTATYQQVRANRGSLVKEFSPTLMRANFGQALSACLRLHGDPVHNDGQLTSPLA